MPTTIDKPKMTFRPKQDDVASIKTKLAEYGKNARMEFHVDEQGDVVGAIYAEE